MVSDILESAHACYITSLHILFFKLEMTIGYDLFIHRRNIVKDLSQYLFFPIEQLKTIQSLT